MSATLRLPVLILWLTIVWALLWGDFGLASLVAGLLVALTVVVLARPTGVHGLQLTTFHPISAVVFVLYFAYQLVKSNLIVTWEVITPGSRINRAIVAIPMHVATPGLVTLVGNAITLTPGTLTVEVREPEVGQPPVLYLHVLHFEHLDAMRRDVLTLERRVVRAFGTREQRAELDRVLAEWQPEGDSN